MRNFVAVFQPLPGNGMGASCFTIDAPSRDAAFNVAAAHADKFQPDWARFWTVEILSPRAQLTTFYHDGAMYAHTDAQGEVIVERVPPALVTEEVANG